MTSSTRKAALAAAAVLAAAGAAAATGAASAAGPKPAGSPDVVQAFPPGPNKWDKPPVP